MIRQSAQMAMPIGGQSSAHAAWVNQGCQFPGKIRNFHGVEKVFHSVEKVFHSVEVPDFWGGAVEIGH
jgi:hypothetical protein